MVANAGICKLEAEDTCEESARAASLLQSFQQKTPHGYLSKFDAFREDADRSLPSSPLEYADLLLQLADEQPQSNLLYEVAATSVTTSTAATTKAGSDLSSSANAALKTLGNLTDLGKNASAVSGISYNGKGDLMVFLFTLATNVVVILAVLLLFSLLRRSFPVVYQFRRKVTAPTTNSPEASPSGTPRRSSDANKDGLFTWISRSWTLKIDEIESHSGLDQAMLVEFTNLGMTILTRIGLPIVLVLTPLNLFFGGDEADDDMLGRIGFANVKKGSWLCWVQVAFVWYVVVVVQGSIFRAQKQFITRRRKWLKEMPAPRATTVLLEQIPDDKRSVNRLRRHFEENIFGYSAVKRIDFVKDTTELLTLKSRAESALARERQRESYFHTLQKKNEAHQERMRLERQIERLRLQIEQSDKFNSGNAFVTFHRKREATISQKMFEEQEFEEMIASIPPDPEDIIWTDLMTDHYAETCRTVTAYICVALVFLLFLPVVVGIQGVASLQTLKDYVPFFNLLLKQFKVTSNLWNGFVGVALLNFAMSLIPTVLVFFFSAFLTLKAKGWLQKQIQTWYFYFLVLFVLLVTAIGSSLVETVVYILENPGKAPVVTAASLPQASDFYLNYITIQWATYAMLSLRFASLVKYFVYTQWYDEDIAKEKCEPEDQDYQGIGSRSARAALLMCIVFVYCTLEPLIIILGIINLAIMRLVYGYLVMEAETHKPDSGGIFWVTTLTHLQKGLFLFILTMTGVLLDRASTGIPGVVAFSSSFILFWSYSNFVRQRWEELPVDELKPKEQVTVREALRLTYKQPELPEDLPVEEEQINPVAKFASRMRDAFSCGTTQQELGTNELD